MTRLGGSCFVLTPEPLKMSPRLSCEAAVTACRWAGVGALWAWFSGLWGHLASHSRVRPAEGATTLVPSSLSPSPARATCACPGPQCMSASCPPVWLPPWPELSSPQNVPSGAASLEKKGEQPLRVSSGLMRPLHTRHGWGPWAGEGSPGWVRGAAVGERARPPAGFAPGSGNLGSRVKSPDVNIKFFSSETETK